MFLLVLAPPTSDLRLALPHRPTLSSVTQPMEPLISGNLTSPALASNIRSGDLDRENSEPSEEWWHYSNPSDRRKLSITATESQAVSKFCAKYLHQMCGEHKDSGILRHGFLASSSEEADSIQNASLKQNGKSEASCSKTLAPHKSTAVGFDDRMLLHSEVERKSLPHPERPDHLRAIAASLATAGIFPGRCQPISAREITREELQMIHSHENIESVELTSQHVARCVLQVIMLE
ncbi:unnamed protein product [Lactuca saligna]|uniref:Histone deacetylase n=1 Tax=Lactuca saligna TaxID=75948 RepID=A0AA36DYT2_LACSI|nr:unnamed protein product [Lactuca saligna]